MTRANRDRTLSTMRRMTGRILAAVGWIVTAALAWTITYALLVVGGN